MCSKCDGGYWRVNADNEERRIHQVASLWSLSGWFSYDVTWDNRTGVHSIHVQTEVGSHWFSLCELEAFLDGIRFMSEREKA